jgi:uncharacterized repeat protein (TIGR03803 family)
VAINLFHCSCRFVRSILFGCLGVLVLNLQPIPLHAQTYTDLHDMVGSVDGSGPYPSGMLAQGRNGNIYGTNFTGGTFGYGTVFQITPAGTLTVLHTFTGGSDGAYPKGGLTLGSDGNFYGATEDGGQTGWGVVYRITPSGVFTALHNFAGSEGCFPTSSPVLGKNASTMYGVTTCGTAYTITTSGKFKLLSTLLSFDPMDPLILATDGNFYGTGFGGGTGRGVIYKLSSSGAVKIIHTFNSSTDGGNPVGPLVQGSDGNLYGTTSNYGQAANPDGTVFKVALSGKNFTTLKNFDSQSSDGAAPNAGLVAGNDGTFYGATLPSSGAPFGTIFKITKTGTFTVLYTFDYTHGAYDYSTPFGDTNGLVYGMTRGGGTAGTNDGVFWSLANGISPFCSIVGFPAAAAGTTVQILGQGFNSTSSIKFGSGSASFTIVSDTYITATIPDTGTSGHVTVTTKSGTLTSPQAYKVIPAVRTFQPTSGSVGTQVTISGGGFTGATSVTFGRVKATFTVNSATTITATVPSGAVTGKVKVTTTGGAATSKGMFTVT